MPIQLTEIIIREKVVTCCRRSYFFTYRYPYDDFVNAEDEDLLYEEIFENATLFCRQLVHDLSNNDSFDRISEPGLKVIIIEIDEDSDWTEDGIKDEVVTKINNCVCLVFGPDVKIIIEDYVFL